ncbi:hypothetical protein HDU76_001613 [Blyttiomyces sp. JEL0837]|nr:hypothetical protein HDU76_001613 [Blyttiomyces sp. JEL0837]
MKKFKKVKKSTATTDADASAKEGPKVSKPSSSSAVSSKSLAATSSWTKTAAKPNANITTDNTSVKPVTATTKAPIKSALKKTPATVSTSAVSAASSTSKAQPQQQQAAIPKSKSKAEDLPPAAKKAKAAAAAASSSIEALEALLVDKETQSAQKKADFRVIAGSYERFLYGLHGLFESPSSQTPKLTPVFMYPSHISCIKTLAATGRHLATGSTDEHIKLYDLGMQKEVGSLMHHTGSITALAFHKRTHLLTASDDGKIGIVRTKDWELLKTLDGHPSAVRGIALHPSGKILLSVDAQGGFAYTSRLSAGKAFGDAVGVKWSPSGDYYAILYDRGFDVVKTETGEETARVPVRGRLNAMAFTTLVGSDGGEDKEVVVIGGEDRNVVVYEPDGKLLAKLSTGHGSRVKDLDAIVVGGDSSESGDGSRRTVVATCSSDGGIKVWDLAEVVATAAVNEAEKPGVTLEPLVSYEAKCRLTCICLLGPLVISKKRKREEDEEDAVDDGLLDG